MLSLQKRRVDSMELHEGALIFDKIDKMHGVRFDQVPVEFIELVIGELQDFYDGPVKTDLESQKAEMCRLLIQRGDDPEWARDYVESRVITSSQAFHVYSLLHQLHLIEQETIL